jgi:outer membrane protein
VESALQSLGEVRSDRYPSLYGSGSVVTFQEPMLVAPLHTFNPDELRADPPRFENTLISSQLTLEYILWDGGSRGDRVAGAEAGLMAADLTREAEDAGLIEQVAAQFLEVRATRAVEAAHRKRIVALESELDRVQRALAEGVAAQVEELRARAALSEAVADLESARADRARSERELARSTGWAEEAIAAAELGEVAQTAPPGITGDRQESIPPAGGPTVANPSVLAAEQRVEMARRSAEAASGTWWPQFFAAGQLNQYGSSNGYFSTEWNLGLGLRYPIWSGGARNSRISRARAELRRSEETLREAELRVETMVDRAESRWVESTARVEALTATVQLMEEVARVERLALEEGAGIQRDLLAAEADLLRARASLIQAEGLAILARISLARARGSLTSDWVHAHTEITQ